MLYKRKTVLYTNFQKALKNSCHKVFFPQRCLHLGFQLTKREVGSASTLLIFGPGPRFPRVPPGFPRVPPSSLVYFSHKL